MHKNTNPQWRLNGTVRSTWTVVIIGGVCRFPFTRWASNCNNIENRSDTTAKSLKKNCNNLIVSLKIFISKRELNVSKPCFYSNLKLQIINTLTFYSVSILYCHLFYSVYDRFIVKNALQRFLDGHTYTVNITLSLDSYIYFRGN